MSSRPSHEDVRDALRAADAAASSYVEAYPRVEAVEWPEGDKVLEAQARTILADLRSQVDSIRYEVSDIDEEDIAVLKEAMAYLQAFMNGRPVDEYIES